MNIGFEKVYVISLITNKERQAFITYQMNELGIPFEFIYGIDYYNIKHDKYGEYLDYPNLTKEFPMLNNDKMYGCAMTHYRAVLQAYELGYNNVLIIEDDICFLKDRGTIENYLSLDVLPKNVDFVTYAPRFSDPIEIQRFLYYINLYNGGGDAYIDISNYFVTLCGAMMYGIMNRDTMKLYLDNQRNSLRCPDQVNEIFKNSIVRRYTNLYTICTDQYNLLKYKTLSKEDFNKCNTYDLWYKICNTHNKFREKYEYDEFYTPEEFKDISNICNKLESEMQNNLEENYEKILTLEDLIY